MGAKVKAEYLGCQAVAATDDAVMIEFSYKFNGEVKRVSRAFCGNPQESDLTHAIAVNALRVERGERDPHA